MNAISILAASSESGLPADRIRQLLETYELFAIKVDGQICISRSCLPILRALAEEHRHAAPVGRTAPTLRFQIRRRVST